MGRLIKVIYLLAAVALINIVQSCVLLFGDCNCDDTPFYYSANKIEITNLDNSASYPVALEDNVMHRSAVAFTFMLYDSTQNYFAQTPMEFKPQGLGINTATAWSCDCYPLYLPQATIESFKIVSHTDVNSTIPAGSDITEYFVGQPRFDSFLDMYSPLSDIINAQNSTPSYDPQFHFNLFMTIPIESNTAQLSFQILLSDGRELGVTTNEIELID